MIVLPDTNFFLHFKHATQIPWTELGEASEVRLIVTRTIQTELDKKKYELKGRAQKRARQFAQLIHSALKEPLVLREKKPRVTLELFIRPRSFVPPEGLRDAKWGDDSFVADALAFIDSAPGERVLLISGDAGPIVTAMEHGVPCRSLIDLDWELPPEADDRDKQIDTLQREIADLKLTGASIEASFKFSEGSTRFELRTTVYPPLTSDVAEALIAELTSRHPKINDFRTPPASPQSAPSNSGFDLASLEMPFEWAEPSNKEIISYHQEYDTWVENARSLLQGLPDAMKTTRRTVQATFTIFNMGVEPAQAVRVSFRASEGLLIRFPDDCSNDQNDKAEPLSVTGNSRTKLCAPPKPPTWKKIYQESRSRSIPKHGNGFQLGRSLDVEFNNLSGLGRSAQNLLKMYPDWPSEYKRIMESPPLGAFRQELMNLEPTRTSFVDLRPRRRDPETFYFKDGRSGPSLSISLECAEFRHRARPEDFNFEILFGTNANVTGGEVEAEVHARNLREPVRRKVAVVWATEERDTLWEARIALGLE